MKDRQIRERLEKEFEGSEAWLPPLPRTEKDEKGVRVLVIGAGMAGLAAAFALKKSGVSSVLLVDQAAAGEEGPWKHSARMKHLRSQKGLSGLGFGNPDLGFPEWFIRVYGREAWEGMHKIPQALWQEYLSWFRQIAGIAAENHVRITKVELSPFFEHGTSGSGLKTAAPDSGILSGFRLEGRDSSGRKRIYRSQRLIVATGLKDCGELRIPEAVQSLPPELWMHSSASRDFRTFKGQTVTVIGSGASAVDNAASALEAGADRVDLLVRRKTFPRMNRFIRLANPLFFESYSELSLKERYRFWTLVNQEAVAPPRESVLRLTAHSRLNIHFETTLQKAAVNPDGSLALDLLRRNESLLLKTNFIIAATGFRADLRKIPFWGESIAPRIRRWEDAWTEECPNDPLPSRWMKFPCVGRFFELEEKDTPAGEKSPLSFIYNFNPSSRLSHGLISNDIPGITRGALRLARGILNSYFKEYPEFYSEEIRNYAELELEGPEFEKQT